MEVNKTKNEIMEQLNSFIWEFKVSDNISYNLEILYKLIEDCNNNSSKIYYKLISITSVSVIEAIMIDFLYRLYSGTNHFPNSLVDKYYEIKNKLNNETIEIKVKDSFLGDHVYVKLKNFNFTPMIRLYEKFNLFGNNKKIYKILFKLAYFRNRIHIQNYFNNFEKDESITFSKKRVQNSLNIMNWVIDYFEDNYKRPWK